MAITTFHPVLIHGRSAWDLGELPRDEYEERLRLVRQVLDAHELSACIIVGSAPSYANLAYLTGVRPQFMTSVMLVHKAHDTVLFAGLGGARGLYHVRAINFVEDVRYYASSTEGARAVLGEWGETSGRLGLVGRTDVPYKIGTQLQTGLDNFELVELDDALMELRRPKRSREVRLLETAASIAAKARDAAVAEFLDSSVPYRAAVAAERTARVLGARDVRPLANLGNAPELRPIEGSTGPTAAHLVLHVGLERAGYWAETTVSFPRVSATAPAAAAVAAMRSLLRPGVVIADVAKAGLDQLESSTSRSLALEIGLGQGIGLGVEEDLAILPTSTTRLEGGEVLSLRCVTESDAMGWCADASTVHVTMDGPRTILPSFWM